MHRAIVGLFAILFAGVAFAESYTLESVRRDLGTGDFKGFNPSNEDNKFTVTPEIPAGGITSADDVTLEWFSDIDGVNIDVNRFEYISSGRWNNGFSFKNNVVIKAREIIFKSHWDNKTLGTITYDPNNTDVRNANVLNIYSSSVTLMGNLDNTSATFYIGQGYASGNCSLTLSGYDENTSASYNLGNLYIYYDSNATSNNTFTVNSGANVSVDGIYFSPSNTGDGKVATVNLNGGVLETRNGLYVQSDGDVIVFNHADGVLKAISDKGFSMNGKTASVTYNLGSEAKFNVAAGKTFTMEDGIKMQAVSGQKAGIKLIGGGTLKLQCDVSAINGTVSVVEDSTLNLGSSWVSNAEVVSVEAGSSVVTEGVIELNGGSQIVLGIASATDFAKIEGASITSDDGSFGSLVFDVDSAAFGEGNSLTLDLANLVDAGVVDWSKFDITAVGYDVSLNGSQVTIAVPEPAEYAVFFGALALFAALYRRAKRM